MRCYAGEESAIWSKPVSLETIRRRAIYIVKSLNIFVKSGPWLDVVYTISQLHASYNCRVRCYYCGKLLVDKGFETDSSYLCIETSAKRNGYRQIRTRIV